MKIALFDEATDDEVHIKRHFIDVIVHVGDRASPAVLGCTN